MAVTSSDEPQDGRVELLVRPEGAEDHEAVREVHSRAFGDSDRVPALVDALRAAHAPLVPVSLVATVGDRVVGHVMLSACRFGRPAWTLWTCCRCLPSVCCRSFSVRESALNSSRTPSQRPRVGASHWY